MSWELSFMNKMELETKPLNIEQLNSLSRIVAEEIKKRCEAFGSRGRVELRDDSQGRGHCARDGGKVFEVDFKAYLRGFYIGRNYLVCPSKQNWQVVCYPHASQAETYTNLRTIESYEMSRDDIRLFIDKNRQIQQFLASVSVGVEEGPGGYPKDRRWIIDPQKISASQQL